MKEGKVNGPKHLGVSKSLRMLSVEHLHFGGLFHSQITGELESNEAGRLANIHHLSLEDRK